MSKNFSCFQLVIDVGLGCRSLDGVKYSRTVRCPYCGHRLPFFNSPKPKFFLACDWCSSSGFHDYRRDGVTNKVLGFGLYWTPSGSVFCDWVRRRRVRLYVERAVYKLPFKITSDASGDLERALSYRMVTGRKASAMVRR